MSKRVLMVLLTAGSIGTVIANYISFSSPWLTQLGTTKSHSASEGSQSAPARMESGEGEAPGGSATEGMRDAPIAEDTTAAAISSPKAIETFDLRTVEQIADDECPSNINNPNPGDPPPGLWWNPHRWGTGWTFAYEDETRKLQLVWHTFYPSAPRGQTWLISDWAQVTRRSNGLNHWEAPLFRPHYKEWARDSVGHVSLDFFGDSATRAKVTWTWDDDIEGIDESASECLYSYFLDGPPSGAPNLVDPPVQEAPPTSPQPGDHYTGIWFDDSVPGYVFEVSMGQRPDYAEADTISIYDRANRPLWVQGVYMNALQWPPTSWTSTSLVYRIAGYNIVNQDCSDIGCIATQNILDGASYTAREYHDYEHGVMSTRAVLPSANLDWPNDDMPLTTGSISGCPSNSPYYCRTITKTTDRESLSVWPPVCTPDAVSNTCKINISWTASPAAGVERLDPVSKARIPHGDDQGIVGIGTGQDIQDTLSDDERVLYRLSVGERIVAERGARAEKSYVTAPSYCVIRASDASCAVDVQWYSPQPADSITVRKYVSTDGGQTYSVGVLDYHNATGLRSDTIHENEQVYYEILSNNNWLDSTSSNPTIPVRAHIDVGTSLCSVPLTDTVCSIPYSWLASADQAIVYRVNQITGVTIPDVQVDHGPGGSGTDPLPVGSYVKYVVRVGSAPDASSIDVKAIRSQIFVSGEVLEADTQCIVTSQGTCQPYNVSWISAAGAEVYRVDDVHHTRERILGDAPEAPTLGMQLHYELVIGSDLHAITPTITAVSDNEGGDATDGAADPAGIPASFIAPTLDTDSDQVGAVAAEFRVGEGGNATYRIPLAVPPGQGGLTPSLAIAYDSSVGDSTLGTGFVLDGPSALTPCRRSLEAGDTTGITADPTELCLDGQRLVLVGNTHMQVGAEYRTEVESFLRIKIASVESQVIAGVSRSALVFTVEAKDGSTRTFGGIGGVVFGQAAAAASIANGVKPQAWLQTKLTDVAGNAINFVYDDYKDGVLGERTLNNVSYRGGTVLFHYVASTRTDVAYSAIGKSVQAQILDYIEVKGPSGSLLRYYKPTYNTAAGNWQRFRPHLLSLSECATQSGPCYPPTTFTWTDATTSIAGRDGDMPGGLFYHELGDVDGDKRTDLWWTSNASQGGSGNLLHISSYNPVTQNMEVQYTANFLMPDGYLHGALWEVADINGDGRDDLLYAWSNNANGSSNSVPNQMSWFLRTSLGKELGPEQILFTVPVNMQRATEISSDLAAQNAANPDTPANLRLLGSSMIMDVDGDGLPDLTFRAPDGQFWVAHTTRTNNPNAPYAFIPVKAKFVTSTGGDADTRCLSESNLLRKEENFSQVTDFDGDGRADLRFIIDARGCEGGSGYRMDSFVSKGYVAADNAFRFQTYDPFGSVITQASTIDEAARRIRTLDVNGDGLTDLVYEQDGTNVWRYRLGGPYSATTDACAANCELTQNDKYVQLVDFDGDGKLDFWMRNGDVYQILLWTGSNWTSQGIPTSYGVSGSDWYRAPADYDGDGTADVFIVKQNGGRWYFQRRGDHHAARGLLTQITNGFGAKTTIDYAPMTYSSVYSRDFDAPFVISGRGSPVVDVAVPNYVVRKVRSSAPTLASATGESSVMYRYAGLKVQGGGRGSLGFRRVSTFDPQTLIEVDTHYSQRFPLTGLAEFTETRKLHSPWTDACASGGDSVGCVRPTSVCAGGLTAVCDDDLPEINDSSTTIRESSDEWLWRSGTKVGSSDPGCVSPGSSLLPPDQQRFPNTTCRSGEPASQGEMDRQALATLQAPIFLARVEHLASEYDLKIGAVSNALRTESTQLAVSDYDAFGNPTASVTTVTSGANQDELTTVTTSSRFSYYDVVGWKLGRLKDTTVQTARVFAGVTRKNVRKSSFSYEGRGLLSSEKVEGMTGAFEVPSSLSVDASAPTVAKYYTYNTFGNKVGTSVCSTNLSESDCRGQASAGKYDFHPNGSVARHSKATYDSLERLPDTTTELFWNAVDGLGREAVMTRVISRTEGGDPTEIRNVDNSSTYLRYGALGRKRFSWTANGDWTEWDARYCTGLTLPPQILTTACPSGMGLAYKATVTKPGAPKSYVFYDMVGRPTVSVTEGFHTGDWITTVTRYDASGNVKRQYDPFFARDAGANAADPRIGAVVSWTDTDYDALNRPVTVTHSGDNVVTSIDYNGFATTTTLPANVSGATQVSTQVRNGLGEVIRTIDANGLEIKTIYDAGGNPIEVNRGAGSSVTTMDYDSLGRKRHMTDPDSAGTWSYTVNGAGEVLTQTSPRGTCTSNEWDGRGRLWRRRDYGPSCGTLETEASWVYDSSVKGLLSQESNGQVLRTFAYDSLGRMTGTTTNVDGKSYLDEWTFDPIGRPFQHFFTAPNMPRTGEQNVFSDGNSENNDGYLWKIVSAYRQHDGTELLYREIDDMDARGNVTEERTAALAAYTLTRQFDDISGRLKWLHAESPNAILQDLSYDYDKIGNVKSRSTHNDMGAAVETFRYDNMQRLLSADVSVGGQITFSRSQSFDAQGNMLSKSDAGGAYSYGKPPSCNGYSNSGPHAVSQANGLTLCYDANGNVVRQKIGNAEKKFTYSAADQITDVTDRVSASAMRAGFRYGPNRERVKRLDYASADSQSASTLGYSIGGAEVRYASNTSDMPSAMQEVRRQVGNILVVQSGAGSSYRIKRQILLTDSQGSTQRVLGAMSLQPTAAAQDVSFDAWGRRRDGNLWGAPTPWTQGLDGILRQTSMHGYTGHEMAESVGLIHMNGRIYDPAIARFLQPDPVIQDPGNSQNWNPYSYVFNNPLVYTDPTGYWGHRQQQYLRTAAAIVITVYSGGAAAGSWGFLGMSAAQASANAYAVVAIGGFAAGAVQTGTLRGAAVGSVSAMAFYGIGSYFKGADWAQAGDWEDAFGSGLSYSGYAVKTLTHGVAGGVMTQLQGGNFGHGFASAGFGEAVSPAIRGIESPALQAIAATVAGGTASRLAGGKFANGALTSAFGYAFNQLAHRAMSAGNGWSLAAKHRAEEIAWRKAGDDGIVRISREEFLEVFEGYELPRIQAGLHDLGDYYSPKQFLEYAYSEGDSLFFGQNGGKQYMIGDYGPYFGGNINYFNQGIIFALGGMSIDATYAAIIGWNLSGAGTAEFTLQRLWFADMGYHWAQSR